MATFFLTWNEDRWPHLNVNRWVELIEAGEPVVEHWSCGNSQRIKAGDRLFCLRQGTSRGIFASGFATSSWFFDQHWDDGRADEMARYVWFELDAVVPIELRFRIEDLKRANLRVSWDHILASGTQVKEEAEERLDQLWIDHLNRLGREPLKMEEPDEIRAPARFTEGSCYRVWVNRYERSPKARQVCIDHYGHDCSVCGFNFEEVYGSLGAGYVQVHHLRDLSSVGGNYVLDPIKDLRPVCPNCHAMLHTASPALSIEDLTRRITRSLASRGADRKQKLPNH